MRLTALLVLGLLASSVQADARPYYLKYRAKPSGAQLVMGPFKDYANCARAMRALRREGYRQLRCTQRL